MQVPKPVRTQSRGEAPGTQASVGDDLWELHAAGAKLLTFCAGRSSGDYEQMEVLRAAVGMLLPLMDEAVTRIEAASVEMAARLSEVEALHAAVSGLVARDAGEAVWRFIEGKLPDLVASAAGELQRWHEG